MESVDLGLSVKWATCNVGGYSPEQYGTYFAWGDVIGQLYDNYWTGNSFWDYYPYELDSNGNLKLEYDAAQVNLGGNWRMPTKDEYQELINNCTITETKDYNGTGIAGAILTSKKAGYTDKSIFSQLPAMELHGIVTMPPYSLTIGQVLYLTIYCGVLLPLTVWVIDI